MSLDRLPPHDNPPHPPLTKQQQTILDAVAFFIQKGELPTVREVGALVGLRSPATVLKHLRALERANLISLNGKSRGIRLAQFLSPPVEPSQPLSTLISGKPSAALSSLRSPQKPLRFHPLSPPAQSSGIPLVGAIAAGKPFESYSEGFLPDGVGEDGLYRGMGSSPAAQTAETGIPIDPRMFVESGEVFALQVEGDSMINAGILDGDYVMIRRQNTVEEGEIAAIIINGEGTLKRWKTSSAHDRKIVSLLPANERFDPIEISQDDAKDVLVIGKYVGLVRGNLRAL